MIFVEYKLHLIGGVSRDPEWIVKGKYFMNPLDNTFVGVVKSPEERDYYVPDTVLILSREDIINRCEQIHVNYPYMKNVDPEDDMSDLTEMNKEDIAAMVDAVLQTIDA